MKHKTPFTINIYIHINSKDYKECPPSPILLAYDPIHILMVSLCNLKNFLVMTIPILCSSRYGREILESNELFEDALS
jgi:hypothetical protein